LYNAGLRHLKFGNPRHSKVLSKERF
jgi:hypothetical protein